MTTIRLMRCSILSTLTLLTLSLGCGASTPEVQPTSEFTEEDAALFEDGIDFVSDPEVLEGRWREEWSESLDARVRTADMIAQVTVNTLRTDTDLDRRRTYRLIAEVREVMLGRTPEHELTLPVAEGEPGFGTVEGHERRILNQPFVAFIKWYRTEAGSLAPHWHLAPAADGVVARTEFLITRRRTAPEDRAQSRTVVHEN